MTWSFPIGRLFGSELRVHAAFFLLLAWIGTASWMSGGPGAAVFDVIFILALFACVVAHEFGHALMARRYGIKTPDITLLPIGGMARMEKMPDKPAEEIAVAVAGPLVNVVIWAVLALLLGAQMSLETLTEAEPSLRGFFERLAVINLYLVVFNLIPAFPMDGGRVLRAALAIGMGRAQATRISAMAGQVIAFLFGYLGLMSGNPILILIAIFVFLAAAAENRDVQLHDLARGVPAREAMITRFETLAPDDRLQAAASAVLRTTQSEFPVLDDARHLVGFLTKGAIVAKAGADALSDTVLSATVRDIPAVKLNDPLETVIDHLQKTDVPAVAVTDQAGHFVGYISRENLGEWVLLQSRPRAG